MRPHALTAALVAGGVLAATGPADAQYGYPYPAAYPPPGGYYQPYAPAPQYPQPYPYPGYGGPPYGPQYGGGEAEFVRSLYHRYLGREPDPQGMDTWVRRLAESRGDTHRVTREFVAAARLEAHSSRYTSPASRYAYPVYRPVYR